MLKPYNSTPVLADGTATWSNAPGGALTLVPSSGGRYPVTVVLDNDPANRTLLVTGPNEERGAASFTSVQIRGATPGDAWMLFVAPSAADVSRHTLPTDSLGRGVVRQASGETLAFVDFTQVGGLPAGDSSGANALFLLQGATGFSAPLPVDAYGRDAQFWDVRNQRRLRFTYEAACLAADAGGATGSLAFLVDGFANARPDAQPLFTIGLGLTNQFADGGRGLAIAPVAAWLELGSPVDDNQAWLNRSTLWANYIKVRLAKPSSWPLPVNFPGRIVHDTATAPTLARFTVESL